MKTRKVYSTWDQAPLKWHWFASHVGLPLGILFSLFRFPTYFNSVNVTQGTEFAWLAWFDLTYAVVVLIVTIVAAIGLIKRKWYGPCCYVSMFIVGCIYYVICLALSAKYDFINAASTLGQLIGCAIFGCLIYLYYAKRKPLFTGVSLSLTTDDYLSETIAPESHAGCHQETEQETSLPADNSSIGSLAHRFAGETSKSQPGEIQVLCPACGSLSPYGTKTCDCGFCFYEATPAPSVPARIYFLYRITVCILVVVLLATSAFLSYKWHQTRELLVSANEQIEILQSSYDSAEERLSVKQIALDSYISRNGLLQENVEKLENELESKNADLFFWENNAVIVTASGNKYHRYGCYHTLGSSFWIYNISLAESKGYEPCPDCNPPTPGIHLPPIE